MCIRDSYKTKFDSPIFRLGGEGDAQEPEVLYPRELDDISLCAEGLGLESTGNADDLANEGANGSRDRGKKVIYARSCSDTRTVSATHDFNREAW